MSNYNSLKATIDANIKQNGNQEITGQILNSVLNQMVTTLGAGYQFVGVATLDPATDPGTPDSKVFYIANGKGKYEKFGGIEVTEDEVVVLYWDTAWHKVATGIASQEKLTELDKRIVIDAILSEAFTVDSLTRDSDGNVISGNIKYSDGIAGTIAITRNADGNATSMVATHGTDSYTLSITRDTNGDVTKTSIN